MIEQIENYSYSKRRKYHKHIVSSTSPYHHYISTTHRTESARVNHNNEIIEYNSDMKIYGAAQRKAKELGVTLKKRWKRIVATVSDHKKAIATTGTSIGAILLILSMLPHTYFTDVNDTYCLGVCSTEFKYCTDKYDIKLDLNNTNALYSNLENYNLYILNKDKEWTKLGVSLYIKAGTCADFKIEAKKERYMNLTWEVNFGTDKISAVFNPVQTVGVVSATTDDECLTDCVSYINITNPDEKSLPVTKSLVRIEGNVIDYELQYLSSLNKEWVALDEDDVYLVSKGEILQLRLTGEKHPYDSIKWTAAQSYNWSKHIIDPWWNGNGSDPSEGDVYMTESSEIDHYVFNIIKNDTDGTDIVIERYEMNKTGNTLTIWGTLNITQTQNDVKLGFDTFDSSLTDGDLWYRNYKTNDTLAHIGRDDMTMVDDYEDFGRVYYHNWDTIQVSEKEFKLKLYFSIMPNEGNIFFGQTSDTIIVSGGSDSTVNYGKDREMQWDTTTWDMGGYIMNGTTDSNWFTTGNDAPGTWDGEIRDGIANGADKGWIIKNKYLALRKINGAIKLNMTQGFYYGADFFQQGYFAIGQTQTWYTASTTGFDEGHDENGGFADSPHSGKMLCINKTEGTIENCFFVWDDGATSALTIYSERTPYSATIGAGSHGFVRFEWVGDYDTGLHLFDKALDDPSVTNTTGAYLGANKSNFESPEMGIYTANAFGGSEFIGCIPTSNICKFESMTYNAYHKKSWFIGANFTSNVIYVYNSTTESDADKFNETIDIMVNASWDGTEWKYQDNSSEFLGTIIGNPTDQYHLFFYDSGISQAILVTPTNITAPPAVSCDIDADITHTGEVVDCEGPIIVASGVTFTLVTSIFDCTEIRNAGTIVLDDTSKIVVS